MVPMSRPLASEKSKRPRQGGGLASRRVCTRRGKNGRREKPSALEKQPLKLFFQKHVALLKKRVLQ
jgi:hypothetical protein